MPRPRIVPAQFTTQFTTAAAIGACGGGERADSVPRPRGACGSGENRDQRGACNENNNMYAVEP